MRVLFATTRGAGHLGPLVPFAQACARAGHDVLVAGPPSVRALVSRSSLPFRAVPEAPAHVIQAAFAPVWARSASIEHVVRDLFAGLHARTALPGMLDAVAGWRPDVVARETMEFASAVAAEVHGVPQVRIGVHLDARVDSAGVLEDLAAPVLGLAADRLRDSPLLTRAPGALDGVLRFRTDALPPREPELVYVTFGSEAPGSEHFPRVYREAAGALAGFELPVLLTIGDRRDPVELGPLPANVRVERWVSQAEVMPRTAAMVSHGGSGSTLAALAAGVPQAFVPLFVDGPANAERVAALGAGIVDGDLAAAVRALLDEPGYRRAARAVADGIAALPPIDDAVEVIAGVASQAPRRGYRSAAGHAIR